MGDLDRILAPFLMGTVLNVFLYGVMVNQCYLYFTWYKNDKTLVKSVVALLLLVDTIMCALNVAMSYGYLVTNFGNLGGIISISNTLLPYPLMTGLSAFIVECFYGWRIHILTSLRPLTACIYVLATIQLLAAIGTTVGGSIIREFARLEPLTSVTLVWLVGSSVTDIIITITLVWYLAKNRTGSPETDDLITRILRVTIQTGMLTSIAAVAVIISFLAAKGTPIHIALGIPVSLLYSTSLLSTLNARRGWVPLNRLRELQPQPNANGDNIGEKLSGLQFKSNHMVSDTLYCDTHSRELQSNEMGFSQFSPISPAGVIRSGGSIPKKGRHAAGPIQKLQDSKDLGYNIGLVDESFLEGASEIDKPEEFELRGLGLTETGVRK